MGIGKIACETQPQPATGANRPRHRPPRSADIPRISPPLLRLFSAYIERYLARHFHAVRLARTCRLLLPPETPLVIYFNHPSWWDPLICLLLARRLFSDRRHYGPIDAEALARYRFFARLGFFGVEAGTRQGATAFIRTGEALLSQPATGLWIAAEGRFSDPRQRPLRLQPGLLHLAQRMRHGVFLPMAIEYVFWEERFPEVLVRFGEGVKVGDPRISNAHDWAAFLECGLLAAMEDLRGEACRRQRQDFDVLLRGHAGIGGVYDLWRRLHSWLRGESFRRTHGPAEP